MPKITGSELISRSLTDWGVDTIFAIAGDHTLPLMDRLAGDGFRFIDTRHEQGAVDMANAWGRIRGVGVSMCSVTSSSRPSRSATAPFG